MSTIPSPGQGVVRLPGEALNSEGYRGLVGRWAPINQSPGGLALYDSSRRGPPGVLTNITVADWESSHLGSVVNCLGQFSRIQVPFRAELEPLELTVRIVFRTGAALDNTVMAKGIVGATDYRLRILAVGHIRVQLDDRVVHAHTTAIGVVVINSRYDLTFTIGNGRVRIWLDGALVLDNAEANAMPQSGFDLFIGAFATGGGFQGKIALCEIWNRCLPKPISPDPHFLARVNDGP